VPLCVLIVPDDLRIDSVLDLENGYRTEHSQCLITRQPRFARLTFVFLSAERLHSLWASRPLRLWNTTAIQVHA
jgi:hypothetical protein